MSGNNCLKLCSIIIFKAIILYGSSSTISIFYKVEQSPYNGFISANELSILFGSYISLFDSSSISLSLSKVILLLCNLINYVY